MAADQKEGPSRSLPPSSSGLPKPDTPAASFWAEHQNLVERSLGCPFVKALAAGTLPSKLFEQYISEDLYFLDVFALALVVAIKKARNLAPLVTSILTDLHSGIAEELKLHKGYQEQLCSRMNDPKAGHQATVNYTDFLMETAESEDVAGIVASMTPCFRLYAYIGCQLAAQNQSHDHQYSEWIKSYSGNAFLSQATKIEDLFNLLAPANDQARLSALYERALLLESNFFDAYSPAPAQ